MASLPITGEGRVEGLLYATPITILGSYTLANNCRKNSVSFDGLTSFFSSAILDVLLSDGVESFIGRFAFTFSLSTIITSRKSVYYTKLHIYFYALISPALSSASCAMIFFLHFLCIQMQKTISRTMMGNTR